jgi:hypothetical protein
MADPLQDVLMEREILKPTMNYSSQVPDDYAIRKALQLLHGIGLKGVSTPRVTGGSMNSKNGMIRGYVLPNEPYVFIPKSDTYNLAKRNNKEALKGLAGIIAHENTHLTAPNRLDESGPYDVQLDVLNKLDASAQEKQLVMGAKQQVVRGTK